MEQVIANIIARMNKINEHRQLPGITEQKDACIRYACRELRMVVESMGAKVDFDPLDGKFYIVKNNTYNGHEMKTLDEILKLCGTNICSHSKWNDPNDPLGVWYNITFKSRRLLNEFLNQLNGTNETIVKPEGHVCERFVLVKVAE